LGREVNYCGIYNMVNFHGNEKKQRIATIATSINSRILKWNGFFSSIALSFLLSQGLFLYANFKDKNI